MSFDRFSAGCPHRVEVDLERRPVNGLNVEIGAPAPRCTLRPPDHWPDGHVLRWLGSGGSALVLGRCSASSCPLEPRHCRSCGHRAEHHDGGCRVKAAGSPFPCGCDV